MLFSIDCFYTCLGEKGSTVLATKPVILVCDLSLMPNETYTCKPFFLCWCNSQNCFRLFDANLVMFLYLTVCSCTFYTVLCGLAWFSFVSLYWEPEHIVKYGSWFHVQQDYCHSNVVKTMTVCSVTYSEKLPVDALPSYRGVALKYSYKVSIGAQRFGFTTKLLRLPFRVLIVPGLYLGLLTCYCCWTFFNLYTHSLNVAVGWVSINGYNITDYTNVLCCFVVLHLIYVLLVRFCSCDSL